MELKYPARIWRDDEGCFQVEFFDVSGAITYGDNLPHAVEMAREALSGVLASMFDRNRTIPHPSTSEGATHWIEPDPSISTPILLRWAREEAKLTQGDLATRLGVTYQTYQKLERSGANPSIKTLAKVARALGRELHIAL